MNWLLCATMSGDEVSSSIQPPLGTLLIGIKPYSNHPDDSHLWIVMCKRPEGERQEFIVWNLNTKDPGYYNGEYYELYEDALAKFNSWGV